jgi:hypothetical protein
MSSFSSMTRNLIFRWRPSKLKQDLNLMLAFDPPKDTTLSESQNMVAWKLLKMNAYPNANNLSFATVNYQAKYAFGASTINGGNRVDVTNILPIGLGETTNLEITKWGNPLFTQPTKSNGESKLFQAINATGSKQSMSIGTIDESENYNPTFNWQVGNTMTIQADLHPVLMGFVNLGYKESQFITADITSKAMWSQNLTDLPTNTTWEVQEQPTGEYTIDRIE